MLGEEVRHRTTMPTFPWEALYLSRSYCQRCEGTDWCGDCYAVKKGRLRPGRSPAPPDPRLTAAPRPAEPATPKSDATQVAADSMDTPDDDWRRRYPLLHARLTQTRRPDGSVKMTDTLLIFFENGRLKLCLHDRDKGEVAFATIPSVHVGLTRLEMDLRTGRLVWRRKLVGR